MSVTDSYTFKPLTVQLRSDGSTELIDPTKYRYYTDFTSYAGGTFTYSFLPSGFTGSTGIMVKSSMTYSVTIDENVCYLKAPELKIVGPDFPINTLLQSGVCTGIFTNQLLKHANINGASPPKISDSSITGSEHFEFIHPVGGPINIPATINNLVVSFTYQS